VANRREQTTNRILDGAARALAKGGFAGTSMEDIATAAGVSKLLLYRDFAGKRELYQAVLTRIQGRIAELAPNAGTSQALRDLVAVARADPDGFTLLFRHAAREPEFAAYASELTDEYVRAAAETLRTHEPDPRLRRWAAEMAVTITFGGIIGWLEHGDPANDHTFEARLLTILRAAAKGAPR
jgi:AcrR family transcriptional regulator